MAFNVLLIAQQDGDDRAFDFDGKPRKFVPRNVARHRPLVGCGLRTDCAQLARPDVTFLTQREIEFRSTALDPRAHEERGPKARSAVSEIRVRDVTTVDVTLPDSIQYCPETPCFGLQ